MAEALQTYDVVVDAGIEACLEVLLDFAHYPDWSSPILEAEVLSHDDAGRGHHVSFALDMRIRTIRYTLAYDYPGPSRLEWRLVDGDLSGVEGSYELEERDGGVHATCRQQIDLGFWVPGPIRRIAERQALRDSVLEFKAEAERRHAGG